MPKLTSYQQKVYEFIDNGYGTGKTAVVKATRQCGKSFLSQVILLSYALKKKCRSVYIAPTLQQCVITYKYIVSALENTPLLKNTNGATFSIEFSNGSDILFRSTAQGTSLRGLTASGILVLDECAFLKNDDINVCLPFVNANNSPILAISTPFARQGYFYDVYTQGITDPTELLKSFDWSNEPETSRFLTPERKEFYKKTMTKQLYNTEILGNFMDNDGMLFTNISECIIDSTAKHDKVFIGIDFGTGNKGDYTVITLLNENSEMIDVFACNDMAPMKQVDWIVDIVNQYPNVVKILAEVNSIGNVYIDAINKKLQKIKLTKWVTSNSSKKEIIQNLQCAFERKSIKIKRDQELLTELSAYEMSLNPKTNTITYNGKQGFHDDYVMSLAIAYKAVNSSQGNYSVSFM